MAERVYDCNNCDDFLKNMPTWEGLPPESFDTSMYELDRYIIDNKLDIEDFTDGEIKKRTHITDGRTKFYWEGSKVFDKIMHVATENFKTQIGNGAISEDKYAQAYAEVILGVIQQSVDFMKFDINQIISAKIDLKRLAVEIWKTKAQVALEVYKTQVQVEQVKAQLQMECCKTRAQLAQMRAQARVLDRQLIGFDDNMYIKLLEYQLNAFSMIYSSGMLDDATLPAALNTNELSDLYSLYKNRIKEILPKLLSDEKVNSDSSLYLS